MKHAGRPTTWLVLIFLLAGAYLLHAQDAATPPPAGAPVADAAGAEPGAAKPGAAGDEKPGAEKPAAQPGVEPAEVAADAAPVAMAKKAEAAAAAEDGPQILMPMIALGLGVAIVLGLIIGFKVNAFIALIVAAVVVSLFTCVIEGDSANWGGAISRVAKAFGSSAGGIGIVIAAAAVIGKCMLDSGSADRIVRAFLRLFGERQAPLALMGSGFVLAVPVFFDTVFYLLVPLARSLHRKTGKNYLMYILAMGAGGAITHTLVPPTPGPLLMAANLSVDIGMMIMMGSVVAACAAVVGLIFAYFADKIMPIPMRQVGNEPDPEPLDDAQLPSLFLALLPVVLPVLMISTGTVFTTVADSERAALLKVEDIQDWPAFRTALRDDLAKDTATPASRFLGSERAPVVDPKSEDKSLRQLIALEQPLSEEQKKQVVDSFNTIFRDKKIYDEKAFLGILINGTAKSKLGGNLVRMKPVDVERMNRALLESAYPKLVEKHNWNRPWRQAANWSNLIGDPNLALLLSTIIAMLVLVKQRGLTATETAKSVETSLMSGGVIILITAGGGAFGAMLTQAQIGPAIEAIFQGSGDAAMSGVMLLTLGFAISTVLKIAQGSSTVAMIVGSAMMAAIVSGQDTMPFHPVYLATAIGAGSLVGSWMNDSGFWIFAKMSGLTEIEALKTWTLMLSVLGFVSFAVSVLLSILLPLAPQ